MGVPAAHHERPLMHERTHGFYDRPLSCRLVPGQLPIRPGAYQARRIRTEIRCKDMVLADPLERHDCYRAPQAATSGRCWPLR
jgi:hypothetical protein